MSDFESRKSSSMSCSFSMFDNNKPKELEVVEIGSSSIDASYEKHISFGILIKNSNIDKKAVDARLRIKIMSADNFILYSTDMNISYIDANSTVGFGENIYDIPDGADHYQVSINCSNFIDLFGDEQYDYQAILVQEVMQHNSRLIKYNLRIKNMNKSVSGDCHIIFRNKEGKITGGTNARFYDLSSNNDALITFRVSPQLDCSQKDVYVIFDR